MNKITLGILVLISIVGCRERTNRDLKKNKAVIEVNNSIPNLNFYIEDGGSMEGFFFESSSFNNSVTEVFRKLSKKANKSKLKLIQNKFLDTKVFDIDKTEIVKIISNLDKHKRPDKIGESNLKEMIKKCIQDTKNNSVSALVSDFIYFDSDAANFKSELAQILDDNNIDITILKFTSLFNGTYFYDKKLNKKEEINSIRPYYIWLFGSTQNLETLNTSDESLYKKLSGYENLMSFSKYDYNNDFDFTVLPNTCKKGRFELDREKATQNSVKGLKNIEFERSQNNFEFSIAVDLSKIPLNEDYITDTSNYNFKDGDYRILGVYKLMDMKFNNGNNEVAMVDQNYISNNKKYTHIITFQSKGKIAKDIKLQLKKSIPNWMRNSSVETENIINNTNKTYKFSNFISALSEVYISEDKPYIEINISLKNKQSKSYFGLIIFAVIAVTIIIYLKFKKQN